MQKLVQNKCVSPPGNEMPSIRTIESFLKNNGINSIITETAPNRGNLFAKIPGTDPTVDAMLLGPSHVDVVPISNPDEWTTDPFGGEIKNGFIYGRGVLDMLFIVAAQVIAFSKIFNDKIELKGDLMLLIVSDEESGAEYGTKHFFDNNLSLFGDLNKHKVFCITEGGGQVLYNKLLLLRTGERGVAWKRLVFKGIPGHGAFPYKKNSALEQASKAVTQLSKYIHNEMPTDFTLTKDYLEALAEFEPDIKNLLTTKNFKKDLEAFHLKNKELASTTFAITHLTFSPNVMNSGVKVNTVPGKAVLDVDVRPLPNHDKEYTELHLKNALGDLNPEIIPLLPEDSGTYGSLSPQTPNKSNFVKLIHESVKMELPDIKVIPSIVGGGTDARFCRNAGMDAYGFAVRNPDLSLDDFGPAHGIDEKIDLKSIDLTLKCYYNLINLFLK